MTRILCVLTAVLSLTAVSVASAAEKKNYICAPGGIEKCVAACNARGGQSRKCPNWCQQQSIQRCR